MKYNSDISLIVGISEKCNLECIYCPQNENVYDFEGVKNNIKDKKRIMSFSLFKRCIDNIDTNLNELHFAGFGEPLLNPDFVKILEYTLKKNIFNNIYIYTNGTLLNKYITDKLSEIFKIYSNTKVMFVFSIGTSSKQIYKDLKGKDLFDKTDNNIKYFISQVSQNKLTHIHPLIQFIVLKENHENLSEFIKEWSDFYKKNKIDFVFENDPGSKINQSGQGAIDIIEALTGNQKKSNILYERSLKNNDLTELIDNEYKNSIMYIDHLNKENFSFREPCPALWKQPFLSAEGELCICCRDVLSEACYGNLSNNLFSELFYNDLSEKWRLSHIKGDFKHPNKCFDCTGFEMQSIEDNEIKDYLKNICKEEIFYLYLNLKKGYKYDYTEINIQNINSYSKFLKELNRNHLTVIKNSGLKTDLCIEIDEDYKIEHNNTLLPCFYWFEKINIHNNNIFHGCKKVKIPYSNIKNNTCSILKGDYSSLNEICLNCYHRFMPTKEFFIKNKEKINKLWVQFGMESIFFERNMPDFNNIDLNNDFLNSKAANYRESYIRFILKYDKDLKRSLELYNILKDCEDPYIYINLARSLIYNEDLNKGIIILKKAYNNNPSDYLNYTLKIANKLENNQNIDEIEFQKYIEIENQYLILWALSEEWRRLQ